MSEIESRNVIVGGGLTGVLTAWILSQQGYSGVLLEKNQKLGGGNRSFQNDRGDCFDFGGHWIYAHRSEFTSNFFTGVQGEEQVRRFPLKRAIFLDGSLIPYASTLEEWPERFRKRIEVNADASPIKAGRTREEFAEVYGRWFADFIFDEVLESFPTCRWRKSNGVAERHLMRWIYPWFFPLTDREKTPGDIDDPEGVFIPESRNYHYWIRHSGKTEEALYPRENGFGNWIRAMAEQTTEAVEVNTGVEDLSSNIDPETMNVSAVKGNGRTYRPERAFWCAPFGVLCRILDWEFPPAKPQKAVLGSFAFDRPISTPYHEIMFGDPDHLIRRVTFPEKLAGKSNPSTCQVELMFPEGKFERTRDEWKDDWLNSLRETGLLTGHRTEDVDIRELPIGVVLSHEVQSFLEQKTQQVKETTNNMVLPHVSVGPGNSSRSVPETFHSVYNEILSD